MQTLPSPFHKKTRRSVLFFWLAWLVESKEAASLVLKAKKRLQSALY